MSNTVHFSTGQWYRLVATDEGVAVVPAPPPEPPQPGEPRLVVTSVDQEAGVITADWSVDGQP